MSVQRRRGRGSRDQGRSLGAPQPLIIANGRGAGPQPGRMNAPPTSRGRFQSRGRGRGRGRGRKYVEGPQKLGKEGRKTGGAASEQYTSYRPLGSALTVDEIESDSLTQLAKKTWTGPKRAAYDPILVSKIYNTELNGAKNHPPKLRRIMLLEISQYVENYLIPYLTESVSQEHILSMVVMLNEKFRESVPAWEGFSEYPDLIPVFFQRLFSIQQKSLKMHERTSVLVFFIHAFQSLENDAVSKQVLRLVQLSSWHSLSPGRLQLEKHAQERIDKRWRALEKREKKEQKENPESFIPYAQRPEATFIAALIDSFLEVLDSTVNPLIQNGSVNSNLGQSSGVSHTEEVSQQGLLYSERFVEFMIDLMSQAPTRRYTHAILEDRAVLIKCKMAPLFQHEKGRLFRQLVDLFQFYVTFPINDYDSEPISDQEMVAAHYAQVQQLQFLLYYKHKIVQELAMQNCGSVANRKSFLEQISQLKHEELKNLVCRELRLISEEDSWAEKDEFLQEVVFNAYERRKSQTEIINAMPLYPTENSLWDENQIPSVHYTGESCLALPKLNLQFLTAHDYLLRNFNLFRLEATYEIREDISDVLQRVICTRDDEDNIVFKGWARMAQKIEDFTIVEVRPPNVCEKKPAAVEADIVIDESGMRPDVREEWDGTKQHDVLFLLSIIPPEPEDLVQIKKEAELSKGPGSVPSPDLLYGLVRVRGCEVIEVKDEDGKLMNDFSGRTKPNEVSPPVGLKRTITVALDAAQYQIDMDHMQETKGEDPYAAFNLLMRRKPKENNFKAVLESIRDLMNEETIIPDWLTNIFLGYGDPAGAQYQNIVKEDPEAFISTVDFKDTFLDKDHLIQSFPDHEIEFRNNTENPEPCKPFKVTFPMPAQKEETQKGKKRKAESEPVIEDAVKPVSAKPKLIAESYVTLNQGPYPQNKPPENPVRFTPVQVGAIMSGVQHGLTMVVGPPGTGKTDTAVQIMHCLYHNQPDQRTLLITHSNQALNDLFEKLLQRDVPSRYLLRLGMGEAELQTEDDFSRAGRVNTMLARRIELLAEVTTMAKQFKVAEDVAYTCETAAHFWLIHVQARWERYLNQLRSRKNNVQSVKDLFPFKEYFANAGEIFKGESFEHDLEIARGCFRHLTTMFQELEECRAFELLKGQADRIKYLQTKQAKIVAMTCTHAALKRREFLEIGFKYDNLIMEESAQILEIESFIPMLLQRQEDGVSRLKRVILIGDHHQLPPVVKNMAFQKYSHLDQSLFTRFIRLGTPYVQLNAQGRARPSLAQLYNWRYKDLGDLPNVLNGPEYQRANPGFAYDYQFIDVPEHNGIGETDPIPYFYQNLAEAEYVVSTFQFMRLRGYPAEKISILTTYNGQKALIRDVIEQRCAKHPAFGRPRTVQTVDKYQGQQNDYVLLSLVRTKAVGHFRDVRRLVVAMSRSRLGLYIFGKLSLFANCYELQPTFQKLLERPTNLALLPHEYWRESQRPLQQTGNPTIIGNISQMSSLVGAMAQEWQIAMHNLSISQNQQAIAQQNQPKVPEKKQEEVKAEEDADMHVVQDLVSDIAEKPT